MYTYQDKFIQDLYLILKAIERHNVDLHSGKLSSYIVDMRKLLNEGEKEEVAT